MRSKNSIYNLMAAIALQIVTLIVGIVLPRVMLLAFGSEINGLVSSIKQFITYLTLVEAGLAGACIYSLYKPLSENDISRINEILSSTKKFYNKSGVIFSGLSLVLAFSYPYIINNNNIPNITIVILTLIFGINGALEFFSMGKYRALLTADQKSYIISIIQAIGQAINCIIIVFMSLRGYSIISVQLFATTSYILRSILFNIYIKKNYKFINFNIKVSEDNKVLHQRWDVLFHQLGGMVVFNSPIALITFFCTLTEVSIYTVYNMVFVGINGIMGVFNNGLVAGIADVIIKDDNKKLQNIYIEYECIYYMIITWVYSCVYILIIPFISIYTKKITDANYIRLDLSILFIVVGILNSIRVPQSTMVNAAGHFKQTRFRALLEVLINIIASIILIKHLGMIGVLVGGICSYMYRTIDFIIYNSKYITNLPIKDTLMRILRIIIASIIVIMPFVTVIKIEVNSFAQWIIWAIFISIWSGIVVFILNYLLERKTVISLLSRLTIIMKK